MKGFSLIELLVVVALLSIVASVAITSLAMVGPEKVDAAARQVADALRFARDEALRTGQTHGVRVLRNLGRVTVYKANGSPDPPFVDSVSYHPVSKQPYDFFISDNGTTTGVTIGNGDHPFLYRGSAVYRRDVLFYPPGNPVHLSGGTVSQLQSGGINIASGGYSLAVMLHPITGRVTLQ